MFHKIFYKQIFLIGENCSFYASSIPKGMFLRLLKNPLLVGEKDGEKHKRIYSGSA